MKAVFTDLNLSITPNTAPSWSGSFPAVMYNPSVRVVTTEVPLTQVEGNAYEYVSLDLWIDTAEIKSEETMSLRGVPYSVRPLIKLSKPMVITPCESLITDSSTVDDTYDVLLAETFEQAIYSLFEGTGWSIKVDPEGILDYPVVTEVSPALTLNGSKLEQLGQLLSLMSPSDLWGQTLSFFVNVFESEVLIVSPLHGGSNVNTLSLDDIRPDELNVRKTFMDLPAEIRIQESDSALLRHEDHFTGSGVSIDPYNFTTDQLVDEEDEERTDINASVTGERLSVGGLVLTEADTVVIDQSTVQGVTLGYGGPFNTAAKTYKYSVVKDKSTEVTTTVEYEYMVGPPYDSEESIVYSDTLLSAGNICFAKSLPMTRQQISRDHGAVVINKDNYPGTLGTIDGIRVYRKKVTTVEIATESTTFNPNTSEEMEFPGPLGIGNPVTTTVEEVYMYDDDGNLTGSRSIKTVESIDNTIVTNTFQFLTPISDQLTGALTYTVETKYNPEGGVITSSVTDVAVDTLPAEQTGPTAESVSSSVEGTTVLREEEYKTYPSQTMVKLNADGSTTDITEIPEGILYVSVETLTLEEIRSYLDTYYATDATTAFYVSLSSKFIDVRGIIGGHLKMTGSELNRHDVVSLPTMDAIDLHDSGFLSAINVTPFRVTGISLDWAGESVPVISLAMCQLI